MPRPALAEQGQRDIFARHLQSPQLAAVGVGRRLAPEKCPAPAQPQERVAGSRAARLRKLRRVDKLQPRAYRISLRRHQAQGIAVGDGGDPPLSSLMRP
nr:hypothetical protein [Crenobacter caeni]